MLFPFPIAPARLCACLVLVATCTSNAFAQRITPAPTTAPPPAPTSAVSDSSKPEKVTRTTLTQMLETLSAAYKINIVSDTFWFDSRLEYFPPVEPNPKDDPAKAMQAFAERWGLEFSQRGGIYVLRHKRWAKIYKEQQAEPVRWGAPSPLRITRLDKPYADLAFNTDDAPDAKTPAQRIDINGSAISVSRLAEAMTIEANWDVRVSPKVSARRVNIFAKDANPSAILGAVAYLVNASEEVNLKPTDAQLAAEKYDANDFGSLGKRQGPSDALRKDVDKLLTKEQLAALQNGQYVEIPMSKMSPDLQKRALNYINMSAQLMSDIVPTPDASKWQKFQLRYHPEKSGLAHDILGVTTVAPNGTEYSF